MRTISSSLLAELQSDARVARVVKVTCADGDVFAFTDTDLPVLVDGVTYEPAPGLGAIRLTSTSDAQVSNQEITATVVDLPESDIISGKFDNASVEAGWCSWANPSAGRVLTFVGKIGKITWSEDGFKADIVSFMKQLERTIGQTYTASCRHRLFGTAEPGKVGFCGVSSSAFTFSGTVASVLTQRWKFTISGAAAGKADGYYSGGTLTFNSGLNGSISFSIKKQTGNQVDLMIPTGKIIQVGDSFTIYAGCDKTLETCKTKFNNVPNFGGFPHINQEVTVR